MKGGFYDFDVVNKFSYFHKELASGKIGAKLKNNILGNSCLGSLVGYEITCDNILYSNIIVYFQLLLVWIKRVITLI